jgi:hypothetical protein
VRVRRESVNDLFRRTPKVEVDLLTVRIIKDKHWRVFTLLKAMFRLQQNRLEVTASDQPLTGKRTVFISVFHNLQPM